GCAKTGGRIRMAATQSDPGGLSRRQIMASGALATIAALAGDRARAAAATVRPRTPATPPRLRLTTTPDLTTVLAESPLPPFTPVKDTAFITPVIQEILAINPAVKVLATPWTPPAWMLASGSFEHGGCTFNNTYKAPYAQYFVKFIQAYQSMCFPISAIT